MSRNQRQPSRRPATKFAHLQKKMQKQAVEKRNVQREKTRKNRGPAAQ